MSQIQNWTAATHHTLNDSEIQEELDSEGRAQIASWVHDPTGTELVYIYEPSRDSPYEVKLLHERDHPKEGRYDTRSAGGRANKELQRDLVDLEENDSTCQAQTADGGSCQNPSGDGSDYCHIESHGPNGDD